MTPPSHRLAWAPPFLVGMAAAVAAEVAVGLLLYAGPGLTRSLTTVLTAEALALAVGLWTAPSPGPQLVERLRRRWLFCLFAFIAGAVFGTSWSVVEDIGGGRVGQGIGLAVLAALPLYACGNLLGGISSVGAGEGAGDRRGATGAAATLGGALGFALTGVMLPKAPVPASLFVACVVVLSLAGMVFGMVLGSLRRAELVAASTAGALEVRVEDRSVATGEHAVRLLYEGGRPRAARALDGKPEEGWEVGAVLRMLPSQGTGARVLVVGGGASALPAAISARSPEASVDVLERSREVVELGREHLGTGLSEGGTGHLVVRVGNLEDLLSDASGPYDLICLDGDALAPLGGAHGMSRSAQARVRELSGERGSIIWTGGSEALPAPALLTERPHLMDRGAGPTGERVAVWIGDADPGMSPDAARLASEPSSA